MSVTLHLTDEDADLSGYKRARLGARSDIPSLVRAITSTEAGPSSGVQATRTAGGTALAWITDPLNAVALTAAAWTLHLWAHESNLAANAAVRVQVFQWTNAEAGTALLDHNPGTELTAATKDQALTSGAATATALADGDRLVIKVLFDDAVTMVTGYTCTLSFNGQSPRAEGDSYLICPDNLSVTAVLPSATRLRVRRLLKDNDTLGGLLEDADLDRAIAGAIETYSRDRPREVADYVSGDGSTYQFALPRFWALGFSRVLEVEYPAGEQPRTILEPDDYEVVNTLLGLQPRRYLEFRVGAPESGTNNLVLRYTARHVHTDELDTIPPGDMEPVCWLAASYAAVELASKMAASSDSTIAADSVNYRDGVTRWRDVAKQYQALYDQAMGRGKEAAGSVVAAGLVTEWDTAPQWGATHFYHPSRRR